MRAPSLTGILSAAVFFTGVFIDGQQAANATDITARVIMEKMTEEQRYAYLAGVIEGLAYSRYANDGKQTDGMQCIYGWFHDDPKITESIYAAFNRFPDYTPGAIIAVMARKKCN